LDYTDHFSHDYTILKAFNPYYAFEYLIRNKYEGWRSLGGILLCFTGVEALFADIGAFSRQAVQISWLGYAYPCLLLAYTGQAAFISENPDAYSNPFYNCVPNGWLYPSLVIAILAAVVASQAMITATFQVSHRSLSSNLILTSLSSSRTYSRVRSQCVWDTGLRPLAPLL
jgi:KUP system potassium uptake protein